MCFFFNSGYSPNRYKSGVGEKQLGYWCYYLHSTRHKPKTWRRTVHVWEESTWGYHQVWRKFKVGICYFRFSEVEQTLPDISLFYCYFHHLRICWLENSLGICLLNVVTTPTTTTTIPQPLPLPPPPPNYSYYHYYHPTTTTNITTTTTVIKATTTNRTTTTTTAISTSTTTTTTTTTATTTLTTLSLPLLLLPLPPSQYLYHLQRSLQGWAWTLFTT